MWAEMAGWLRGDPRPDEVCDRVALTARKVVSGCEHAGVFLADRAGDLHVVPTTGDDVGRVVEVVQRETGQGPCRHTYLVENSCVIGSFGQERRWPEFCRRAARETGMTSMMSLRLFVDDTTVGVLVCYSGQRGAFDASTAALGAGLAMPASLAIAASRQRERAANLECALASNQEIGIAVGILMAQHACTRDEAFHILRLLSQDRNIKLRDLARILANTGSVPQHTRTRLVLLPTKQTVVGTIGD